MVDYIKKAHNEKQREFDRAFNKYHKQSDGWGSLDGKKRKLTLNQQAKIEEAHKQQRKIIMLKDRNNAKQGYNRKANKLDKN